MFYIKLAISVLLNNRRQYLSLFSVCAVGVAIMLSAVTLTDGMLKAMRQKAKQYYGGDLQFMGGDSGKGMPGIMQKASKIKSLLSGDAEVYVRYTTEADGDILFYEGTYARLKSWRGVNFAEEKSLFDTFTFIEGGAQDREDHNAVLLSEPIAKKLGAHAGDAITVQTTTVNKYTNTRDLIVTGIFLDSSLFGMYTGYIDRIALCQMIEREDDFGNRISMYYPYKTLTPVDIVNIHQTLSKEFPMYRITYDKNEFYDARDEYNDNGEELYGIITLDSNMQSFRPLLDAMRVGVLLIVLILVTIISVGIGSTYRVIVIKRTSEIGTYRALGMKPSGVRTLFLTETFFLMLAGFVAGAVFSLIINAILSRFNFSIIPAFDIFLINGYLQASFNLLKLLGFLAVIIVTTLLSVLFTIRNVVHISPVGALATTS